MALKGPDTIAQGAALGNRSIKQRSSERARPPRHEIIPPLQGFVGRRGISTQGCALGYHMLPFQGNQADDTDDKIPPMEPLTTCHHFRYCLHGVITLDGRPAGIWRRYVEITATAFE